MAVQDIPYKGSYLEYLPLNKIAKYQDGPPKNGIPFIGYPQQHPTDTKKFILVYDPLGKTPMVLEFKVDDTLYVEDVPQAVTEKGEGVPMVKLWIRRGSRGMLLEPFEVNDAVEFLKSRCELKERFTGQVKDTLGREGRFPRSPGSTKHHSG